MRVRKLKYARKTLTFYKSYFGFLPPHRVLVDGTFCKAALDGQVNIREQLTAYFDEEVEVLSTPCSRHECEMFGAILSGPLQLLRRFPEYPCQHDPPIAAVNCLLSLCRQRNKEKLIIASQDSGLLEKGRERIGLPLLLLSHNSVHLEKPSTSTRRAAVKELDKILHPSDYQHGSLLALKRTELGESESKLEFKKRKRKGQNPLSCKPRHKRTGVKLTNGSSGGVGSSRVRRKRRYRMRVSSHIREPLRALVAEIRAGRVT